MSIKQSFILALKSLATSKMRALLTMLGIIIGVAAVIIIISLGDGMQKMMNDQFATLGANLIQVNAPPNATRSVNPAQMYQLAEENPTLFTAVSPVVMPSVSIKYNGETYKAQIWGGSEDYATIRNLTVEKGRFLQYIDVARMANVCVIGSYLDREAFGGSALGKSISLGGNHYLVIGVLKETAESKEGTDDAQVIIPYLNASRLAGSSAIGMYFFSGTSADTAASARGLIERELTKTLGDDKAFQVMTAAEMMEVMGTMTSTMMTVLVAIAGISLLVGGIGIMNIMLVSVTERTREIGIRKSLGAKRRDVRLQFIIEAGTTSAIGGVIGIILGVALASVAGALIASTMGGGFSAVPSPSAIGIAFGVSVGVGILFGYLPANKAAGLNPIDALRYD